MLDLLWIIQVVLCYFAGFTLSLNLWKDSDGFWVIAGFELLVAGLMALMLGQPYWIAGLLAAGALACFIRVRLRSK